MATHPPMLLGTDPARTGRNSDAGWASEREIATLTARAIPRTSTRGRGGIRTQDPGFGARNSGFVDRRRICTATVYRVREKGELCYVRVSNAVRVPESALTAYMQISKRLHRRRDHRAARDSGRSGTFRFTARTRRRALGFVQSLR
jgi:hypothetical protein